MAKRTLHAREGLSLSLPWLAASCVMVLLIWGNSLVPGTGSGSLSLEVMSAIRSLLGFLGLPSGWVTNYLVRKTAHFTEYAVLGVLVSNALGPAWARNPRAYLLVAAVLALVPSIDETIQLFVPGRSGQVTDVLLDCCGAATGAVLRALVVRARGGQTRV